MIAEKSSSKSEIDINSLFSEIYPSLKNKMLTSELGEERGKDIFDGSGYYPL